MRSNAQSKYQASTDTTCELILIQDLLSELHLLTSTRMRLYCDNTTVIRIEENVIFHEHSKHIEADCNLVHQKVTENKIIELQYVSFINQLAIC